jgi:hypothetical protein
MKINLNKQSKIILLGAGAALLVMDYCYSNKREHLEHCYLHRHTRTDYRS